MPREARYDDAALLDRSYDLLWRDGCDAVSMRDLEVALDLKAPSIYRRFHSRDELIARSVDRYVERVVGGRVRRHLDRADDPVAGLRAFLLSALDPAPGEAVTRGCLLAATSGQAACSHPAVRSAVDAGLAVIEEAFRTQVGAAAAQGRCAPCTDPDALAGALVLAFQGLVVLGRAGRPGLGAAADQLVDTCFPNPARSPDTSPSTERHPRP